MGSGPRYRGTIDNPGEFAREFVQGRLGGFEKDMQICLTRRKLNGGITHAYFPALASCCGIIEYFTALYFGKIKGIGWRQIADWTHRYLPQSGYDEDTVRILVQVFRHPVAHRGIASGVWIDRNHSSTNVRRLTWKVLADTRRPAISIVPENGTLTKDPPWDCPYTHRVHIHLKAMKVDIRNAANRYIREIASNKNLQNNFLACMRQLYPN
jgi:hypothetical protein